MEMKMNDVGGGWNEDWDRVSRASGQDSHGLASLGNPNLALLRRQ